jgi:large subunit ribosomal protein L25
MEKISLEKRDLTGKKARRLLKEGFLPAVLYNAENSSKNVQISASDAKKLLNEATLTTILDISFDGKDRKAIIKEVDRDPITEEIRHISFFEIDESKPMVFDIPFELEGISPAVKNNLGVLVHVLPSLEVRCKVDALVPSIKIDISSLEYPGQSISVSDIKLPEGISLINEEYANSAIVTITQLQKEEVFETETPVEEGEEGETEETAEEETPAEEAAEEPKE